jgi:hypothetical protein
MKTCTICKIEKPFSCFSKRARAKDGFASNCKECARKWRPVPTITEPVEGKPRKKRGRPKMNPEEKREKQRLRNLKRYNQNKQLMRDKAREYRQQNPDKFRESCSKSRAKHPETQRALQARRRAIKLSATPAWLTDNQKEQIKWFFRAAKMMTETTGVLHHVDHIHPLKGKPFNGLHVPWNLQCIPAKENIKKGNRTNPNE